MYNQPPYYYSSFPSMNTGNAPEKPSSPPFQPSGSTDSDANHIYFYTDVSVESCLSLVRELKRLDLELRTDHLSRRDGMSERTPIWLHIQSFGGQLFPAFAAADQLSLLETPVHTVIEGIAGSAATLIALSGQKRFILRNSFMLIHQLSSFKWGTHEQFKDEMEIQGKLMDRLVHFYAERSTTDEKKLRDMLTRDYWIDADTAFERGFVDQILGK